MRPTDRPPASSIPPGSASTGDAADRPAPAATLTVPGVPPVGHGAPSGGERALPPALRITADDELRRVRLVRMKRVAAGLLVASGVLFAVARAFESRLPWLTWVRAFAEAALVGGIADWFAVTALFRHPLGLRIPHTAIVPARKDRIGVALGTFVQRNFLQREVVAAKLAAMHLGERTARWLAEPANARRLAGHMASGLAGAVAVLRDEDVQQVLDRAVVARLRTLPAAPLLARGFGLVTEGGRHQALLDDALRLAARFVAENEELIRERIKQESPWWVPGLVENRLHERIVSGVENTLAAVAADPDHPLRARYDDAVQRFVESLRSSPEVIARAEALKRELLDHPAVGEFSREVWTDLKGRITRYAERMGEAATEEPEAVERWLSGLGRAMLADPALTAKVDQWASELVTYAVEQARDEVAQLIATTVAQWDADATSRKIELQIGRDLQFIRVNGTLVGGLVGLLLHAFTALLRATP
jgi:uncharacterized membrane-anchored protein YjiN (DUF445 family)